MDWKRYRALEAMSLKSELWCS